MEQLPFVDWFEQIFEQRKTIVEVVERCGGFWYFLTDKEKHFLESIARQIQQWEILSEKQFKWIKDIKKRIHNGSTTYDQWVNRKICNEFIKSKFGTEKSGMIIAYHYRTNKAINCDLVILEGKKQARSIIKEAWIPISQVSKD